MKSQISNPKSQTSTKYQRHNFTKKRLLTPFFIFCIVCGGKGVSAKAGEEQTRKAMKESLVYLEVSSYGYDQFRPWRNTEVAEKGGVGCAVGANLVITPAWTLTDARLIQARIYGQNEYVPGKIRAIDYEIDLALVELEPNALKKALRPLKFASKFKRGTKLNYYWLDSSGELTTGQGYLDRAEVHQSTTSHTAFLNYIVTNTSQETAIGQLYCDGTTAVGIACWAVETKEAGLIPAEIINEFLSNANVPTKWKEKAKDTNYPGIPVVGFSTQELTDPATRAYLKMPATMQNGIWVTNVYALGTGNDLLKTGDVILAIDGKDIDAFGKFQHPVYDRVLFHHLITTHRIGDEIGFEIWRDGGRQQIKVVAKNFDVSRMLIPSYEYGQQPEYIVTGGFVFQKLTRPYLMNFGKDWTGKASPHLFHYYRDLSFKPSIQRKEIVVLSYVLPSQISIGYLDLGQLVVSKFNDMPISCLADIIKAQSQKPDSNFDVVEFELDNPTVVIPRRQLPQADALIGTNYGIRKLTNVRE